MLIKCTMGEHAGQSQTGKQPEHFGKDGIFFGKRFLQFLYVGENSITTGMINSERHDWRGSRNEINIKQVVSCVFSGFRSATLREA